MRVLRCRRKHASRHALPKRPRIDPPAGTTAGYRPLDAVRGKDPSKHYVWVNPNDPITGLPMYESMGYVPEHYSKDGPRPVVGTYKEGQPITCMGGPVLMSAPIEQFEEAQQAAWGHADMIAKRIKDPTRDKDFNGYRGDETYSLHASVQEER